MITSINANVNTSSTTTVTKINNVSNKPDWKSLCHECSSAAKKAGWTKCDSKKLLKEIREKYNI